MEQRDRMDCPWCDGQGAFDRRDLPARNGGAECPCCRHGRGIVALKRLLLFLAEKQREMTNQIDHINHKLEKHVSDR